MTTCVFIGLSVLGWCAFTLAAMYLKSATDELEELKCERDTATETLAAANADAAQWRNEACDAEQALLIAQDTLEKLTRINNKRAAKRREYRKAKARK